MDKSNDIIKENFRYLAESGKPILVRIPMINTITNTEENKTSIITNKTVVKTVNVY